MNLLLDNLRQDVESVYSPNVDFNYRMFRIKTTCIKDYELKEGNEVINSIQIIYDRFWVEKVLFTGVYMCGKAEVKLLYRDELLENSIKKIIEEPLYFSMSDGGLYPVVSTIYFGIYPKI